MSNQSFSDKLNKTAQDMRKVGEALAEQPPRYSHRNGETEPPTVDGYYWVDCPSDWLERGTHFWRGMAEVADDYAYDLQEEQILFDELPGVQWWGPVTPPWDADAARPTHYHPFAEDDVRTAFSSDVKPLFDDEQRRIF